MRSRSGAGDRVERVRRGDEHHVREVERHVEVVVAEGRVLLGVEHLEHRADAGSPRKSAPILSISSIMNTRVVGAGVAQRADDRARHRADVGAAVAADLGLVAHAADARCARTCAPARAAIERPSDVLPTPGGPTKHRIEPRASRLELAHGEELEDAVLDLLDVVVVVVEHLARVLEVEVVLGRACPTAATRSTPGRCGSRRARPPPAAASRAARARARPALRTSSGSSTCAELLAQLVDLGLRRVPLAELLLDRLELLAQEVLALGLVELGLHLRLDPRADRDDLELAREDLRQPPQPLGDVDLLEQLLLLLGLDPQRAGDQVRRARRGPRGWRPPSAAPRAGTGPPR